MSDKPTSTVREDGRPEVYCVPLAENKLNCVLCSAMQPKNPPQYDYGQIFMTNPHDSSDGAAHLVCHGHLPEDAVIFDPKTGMCRNKKGDVTWDGSKVGA
jgi:hypothetical protein